MWMGTFCNCITDQGARQSKAQEGAGMPMHFEVHFVLLQICSNINSTDSPMRGFASLSRQTTQRERNEAKGNED